MPTNEDLTPVEDIAEFLTGVGWESLSEAGREQFRALFHQARGRAADGGYVYRSVDRLFAGIEVGPTRSGVATPNMGAGAEQADPDTVDLVEDKPVAFSPIGIGEPLRITLEQVYVGADRNSRGTAC